MDTIADFLIRIKNNGLAERQNLSVPFSVFNFNLSEILKNEGFLEKAEVVGEEKKKNINLILSKNGGKICKMEVKMVSKQGRRIYLKAKGLKNLRGLWITIVSTPAGLMTARQAIKKNLGGEIICKIMRM